MICTNKESNTASSSSPSVVYVVCLFVCLFPLSPVYSLYPSCLSSFSLLSLVCLLLSSVIEERQEIVVVGLPRRIDKPLCTLNSTLTLVPVVIVHSSSSSSSYSSSSCIRPSVRVLDSSLACNQSPVAVFKSRRRGRRYNRKTKKKDRQGETTFTEATVKEGLQGGKGNSSVARRAVQ